MASRAISSKSQHVVPSEKGWAVLKSGASRATSKHATQGEAIAAATRIAQNQKSILYIHGEDGRIRERKPFGNDPHIPKG